MSDKSYDDLTKTTLGITPEKDDAGPCASRPVPKYVHCFHVKNWGDPKKQNPHRSFDYAHRGRKSFDRSGIKFMIEFNEPEHCRLTVHGTNLWKIYNYLLQNRLEWIEQADRTFGAGDKPFITRIEIEEVKPQMPPKP